MIVRRSFFVEKLKMEDIARMANVSRSAVSIALNGKAGISQETREKIFKVINENGYEPLRKRNKKTKQLPVTIHFIIISNNQGMVTQNFQTLPFFNSLISIISNDVSQDGRNLQIDIIDGKNLKSDLEKLVNENKVQAALILATELTRKDVILLDKIIPNVVFIDTCYPDLAMDFVTMDNYQGAYQAGKHIINKGYKRIAYAASNKRIANFEERKRGFYQALYDMDYRIDEQDYFMISPTRLNPDEKEPLELINRVSLPDAIFCEDDYIAIRLIKEFNLNGIRVPKDVAVMGFDDIYEGTLISPELTTIKVPLEKLVEQVLNQLQSKINDDKWVARKTLITTSVIERNSL